MLARALFAVFWLVIAAAYAWMFMSARRAKRVLDNELRWISPEGGIFHSRNKEPDSPGGTLNLGLTMLQQLREIQAAGMWGALGAVIAAILSIASLFVPFT